MARLFPEVSQLAGRVRTFLRPHSRQQVTLRHVFHHERVLGTSLELRVQSTTLSAAHRAECAVLSEIDRLELVFSSFIESSELRRWQRTLGTEEPLSPELVEVLTAAERWHSRTVGAFHPGAEEWTRLWQQAALNGQVPPAATTMAETKSRLAKPLWELHPKRGTAVRLAACAVTLNAIAKGYIVDRACERALSEPGVQRVLLNVGGDLRIAGTTNESRGEIVGIADPCEDAENAPFVSQVRVTEGAVATSGGSRRGLRIGERWYSHVFDPRTGQPVEQVPSASVIAPTAMDADALATAFSVLPPAESLALADSLPGVACLLITAEGRLHRSLRWMELEEPSEGW